MWTKDELVLQDKTWVETDHIEYNNSGVFQTSNSNMPGYYIVLQTCNVHTLQGKYTYHAFYFPVLIPECELVCPAKFMTPMTKTSYWYHNPDEAIPVMVKLKTILMHCI